MATHKSALKAHRNSETRREVNRSNRSRLRKAIKEIRTAADSGDVDKARTLLPGTLSLIDQSVRKGTLHENAGSRHKSRIARAINRSAAR